MVHAVEATAVEKPEEFFAILELMGRQKIAGRMSEMNYGGGTFVRIDVPSVNGKPAFTKMFTHQAIYGCSLVSEEIATSVAKGLSLTPVSVWDFDEATRDKIRNLPAPSTTTRSIDDGDQDEGDGLFDGEDEY